MSRVFGVIYNKIDGDNRRFKCMDGERFRGMLDAMAYESERCLTAIGFKTKEERHAFACGACSILDGNGLGEIKDVFKAAIFLAGRCGFSVVPVNFDMVGISLSGKVK